MKKHFLHGAPVNHQKRSGFYRSLKRWSKLTAAPQWSIFPIPGESKQAFISRTTSVKFMRKLHPKYSAAKLAEMKQIREKNLRSNFGWLP